MPDSAVLFSSLTSAGLLSAALMCGAFLGALFVGSVVIPGQQISGPDSSGKSHTYKLNGLTLFLLTVLSAGLAHSAGWFSLSMLYTHFAALFVVANLFAFAMSSWLYFRGRHTRPVLSGGWHGYFFGVDANPTLLGVDLKLFSYRPSLIGLALLNASFAAVQYDTYGELTVAMILYQAFTFLYVLNYFQFEQGMIHTWDMVSERFGWMLIWGDYVLVPFFYCFVGWWLVHPTGDLTPVATIALVLLFCFGFWLFRGANEQKHRFKRNPETRIWGRPAHTLDGRLLVSGFWGIGRHLNYTGEICIYFAFALTAGFDSWLPYILPVWLTGLLWHRSRRDERRCRAKYGALWERYTRQVRFSMLPFVH